MPVWLCLLTLPDGRAHARNTSVFILLLKLRQMGDAANTRSAPRGPEFHDVHLAFVELRDGLALDPGADFDGRGLVTYGQSHGWSGLRHGLGLSRLDRCGGDRLGQHGAGAEGEDCRGNDDSFHGEFLPMVTQHDSRSALVLLRLHRIPATNVISHPGRSSDHEAHKFLKKRKLPVHDELNYIDDEEKLEGIVDKYKDRLIGHASRIIIPFYDRHGNLIGVTGRAIDNRKKPRYLTLRFTEENGPMIFGLNAIDKNKKVYVVEGPLDALFLPNCVAVSGSDFMKLTQSVSYTHLTLPTILLV